MDLSIDIGGTKVRVIVFKENLEVYREEVVPTSDFFRNNGKSDLYSLLAYIADKVGKDFKRIGLSMNCNIKDNIIIYSGILNGETNLDLNKVFRKYFKFKKLIALNDVYSMAKSEIENGIGKKFPSFLFVNLGTGIRVVNIVNRNIVIGGKGTAGEISQDPVWVEELDEYITTDYLASGKGIANIYNKMFKQELSAEEIFKLDSKNYQKVIDIFIKYLVQVIRRAYFFYSPEAIVFEGSLVKSKDKWFQKFKESYTDYKYEFLTTKKIFISKVNNPASFGVML